MPLKLFVELIWGTLFHFRGDSNRKLIKSDDNHYISTTGRHVIHPHVAVEADPYNFRDLADQEKENGRSTDDRKDPRDY